MICVSTFVKIFALLSFAVLVICGDICHRKTESLDGVRVSVSWSITGSEIDFTVDYVNCTAEIKGYAGIGIMRTNTGSLLSGLSDFWLARVVTKKVEDCSFHAMKLKMDTKQDISNFAVSERRKANTLDLTFRFKRSLVTGDIEDDLPITFGNYKLLYAYRYLETVDRKMGRTPSGMGWFSQDVNFFNCEQLKTPTQK